MYSNAKVHRDIPEFREVTPFADAVRTTIQWMESQAPLKRAEDDPFESRLIEMYEAFAKQARTTLATKAQ